MHPIAEQNPPAAGAGSADGRREGAEGAEPLRILSLGAGVQSTTLLLMSIRGDLPRIDHAIFADTQAEPAGVYRHLERLQAMCRFASIPLHVVTAGNLREDARRNRKSDDGKRFASIPLFVRNADGTQGRIRRQCTAEYKIEPIERFIRRELLGIPAGRAAPRQILVEQWLGITTDEARRAKPPEKGKRKGQRTPIWWKRHAFPLMGVVKQWGVCDSMFGPPGPVPLSGPWGSPPLSMDRAACVAWLRTHYPEMDVPRSACCECPYRSNAEWQAMKENDPTSFALACNADETFRNADEEGQSLRKMLVGLPYIHRSCRPLREVDFTAPNANDPMPEIDEDGETLFHRAADTECEGMCGL